MLFRSWLKTQIQNMKIMASGPITSWEIDWETVETVSGFILGGSKITADGDCSHEIITYTSDFMGGCPPLPLSEKELTYSSS